MNGVIIAECATGIATATSATAVWILTVFDCRAEFHDFFKDGYGGNQHYGYYGAPLNYIVGR